LGGSPREEEGGKRKGRKEKEEKKRKRRKERKRRKGKIGRDKEKMGKEIGKSFRKN
jgi:hypothetical protein